MRRCRDGSERRNCKREHHSVRRLELFRAPAEDCGNGNREHHRAEHGKLRRAKLERPQHARLNILAEHGIAGMPQRQKAVGGIPEEIGGDHDQREQKFAPAQQHARAWSTSAAGEEVDHGVFRQQSRTDGGAEQHRPAPIRPLQQAHIGKERQRPEQNERHVGRHDAGGECDTGAEACQLRGPESGLGAVKCAPDPISQETCPELHQRRGARTQASLLPQIGSAAAITQASSGGLEK